PVRTPPLGLPRAYRLGCSGRPNQFLAEFDIVVGQDVILRAECHSAQPGMARPAFRGRSPYFRMDLAG
ncbi:MAG: hypothetical protein WBL61_25260, partial [Bryobacteraceae bacterium]